MVFFAQVPGHDRGQVMVISQRYLADLQAERDREEEAQRRHYDSTRPL